MLLRSDNARLFRCALIGLSGAELQTGLADRRWADETNTRHLPFLCADAVLAQCPAGILSAGNPQCLPPDAPGWKRGVPVAQEAQRPHWSSRWGAIAVDGLNSMVGTAATQKTQAAAEREAMRGCTIKGGRDCKVSLAYRDRCVALAWGADFYIAASAIDADEASAVALRGCGRSTTDYSECVRPEWQR
ncbi:DUF4189 domain-containing protein [Lysobacter firmicutimachus]|uniref:DUF4189 domain-containing protein n=1 Tax=Lysobacter firmicutimachus TaxID=1792846 RepID=A0AAU8MST9_9GAMM